MINTKVNLRSFFNQCILCNSKAHSPYRVCKPCLEDLPWLKKGCEICALPLAPTSTSLICAECQKKPPCFDKVNALFEYAFPVDRLIGQIKYSKKPQLIGHLAQLAVEYMERPADIDCIIPIPMHNWGQFQRGFNQAELLANEIASLLELPINTHCLRKVKRTERQMNLARSERLKNQKDVFKCNGTNRKNILLVDDVMTTGATLEAASRCLKKAGVQKIHVFVLARTERY